MQPETHAAGTKLGIGLEGTDIPAFSQFVHGLQVTVLVWIDAPVDHQSFAAIQLRHNIAGLVGVLNSDRLTLLRRRHKTEHHDGRITVQKHILDELVRTQAIEIGAIARHVCQFTAGLFHAGIRPG